MHHPTDKIADTTAYITPVVEHWLEREIAQWVHPMKDLSDDPSHHERTLLPRSYISLPELLMLKIISKLMSSSDTNGYHAYLGTVISENSEPWTVNLLLGETSKTIKFKIGTGADVIVNPHAVYQLINSPKISRPKKNKTFLVCFFSGLC